MSTLGDTGSLNSMKPSLKVFIANIKTVYQRERGGGGGGAGGKQLNKISFLSTMRNGKKVLTSIQ